MCDLNTSASGELKLSINLDPGSIESLVILAGGLTNDHSSLDFGCILAG